MNNSQSSLKLIQSHNKIIDVESQSPNVQLIQNMEKIPIFYPSKTEFVYSQIPIPQIVQPQQSIRYVSPIRFRTPPPQMRNFNQILEDTESRTTTILCENEKLKFLLVEKEEELKCFKEKCDHLLNHINDDNITKNQFEQLERKLKTLVEENENLQKKLMEINQDLNHSNQIIYQQELKITDLTEISERLKDRLKSEEPNSRFLKESLSEQNSALEIIKKKLKENNNDKENFRFENEELLKKLRLKDDEIQKLKIQIDLIEMRINESEERLKKMTDTIEYKDNEINERKILLQRSEKYIEELKIQYRQDEDSKISKLSSEIERLNNTLKSKLIVIEDWRIKFMKMEELNKEKKNLEYENIELKKKISQFKEFENNFESLQKKNNLLKEDNIHLNRLLKQKNDELENQKINNQEIENWRMKTEGLKKRLEEKENEVDRLRKSLLNM